MRTKDEDKRMRIKDADSIREKTRYTLYMILQEIFVQNSVSSIFTTQTN